MFSIIFYLALFLGGMYVENRYSPRIEIKNNTVSWLYKTKRTDTTKTTKKLLSF